MGAVTHVAVVLILLHGVDGHEIAVSTDEITSMHCRTEGVKGSGLFVEGVNAVINLSDGKYVSVRETCGEVHAKILATQEKWK